jgi:hypothetical protein
MLGNSQLGEAGGYLKKNTPSERGGRLHNSQDEKGESDYEERLELFEKAFRAQREKGTKNRNT